MICFFWGGDVTTDSEYVRPHMKNGRLIRGHLRRNPNRLGRAKATTPRAIKTPTIRDLDWAAGFLEGEGCFHQTRNSESASATQNLREPLERLQRLLGGGITIPRASGVMCWQTYGPRARGIAMTLYGLLSARRQRQIQRMLGRT